MGNLDKKIKRAQKSLGKDPANQELLEKIHRLENERFDRRIAMYESKSLIIDGRPSLQYIKHEEEKLADNSKMKAAEKEIAKFTSLLEYAQKYLNNLPPEAPEKKRIMSQNRLNLRLKNIEDAIKKLHAARAKQARRAEWLDKIKNSSAPSTSDTVSNPFLSLGHIPSTDVSTSRSATHNSATIQGFHNIYDLRITHRSVFLCDDDGDDDGDDNNEDITTVTRFTLRKRRMLSDDDENEDTRPARRRRGQC